MNRRATNDTASRRFRRGAAILPSLFTTGNLFLGFWAVVRSLHGEYAEAALLIGGAIVLDILDGRIARLTGTTSEFGGELDSLADAISFGVAPAVLAYQWAFGTVPRAGWLASFLFMACGVIRLARFNVQRHVVDGRYFVGLPIPAAAGQLATIVYFRPVAVVTRSGATVVVALLICLAFLMVSTLRYWSFKSLDLRARRSYINVLFIAMTFALIALYREFSLLGIATLYSLSAPLAYVAGMFRRRSGPPPVVATGEGAS